MKKDSIRALLIKLLMKSIVLVRQLKMMGKGELKMNKILFENWVPLQCNRVPMWYSLKKFSMLPDNLCS